MATEQKIRRGTAAEHESFTGAQGEITYDTTNNIIIGHDGVTVGGIEHVNTNTIKQSPISSSNPTPGELLIFADTSGIPSVNIADSNRLLFQKSTVTPDNFAALQINDSFNYTGGTPGNVSSSLNLITDVSADVTNFVWGVTSVLNNSSNAGENVAIYGQGNRDDGNGPVWAGVFEARDKTNADSTGRSGTVGIEVDVFANGADVSSNRVGIDVVVGKGNVGGVSCQAEYGVRIAPQDFSISNGTWKKGVAVLGATDVDYLAQSESFAAFQGIGTNTYGVFYGGTAQVGISLDQATISGDAIRLASGQKIAFENTGSVYLRETSGLIDASARMNLQNSFGLPSVGNISSTATAGANTLPSNPDGFLIIKIDGVDKKIPFYGA